MVLHLKPVSYTHLDVYKRQTLNNSIKNNFGSRPPKNAVFIQIFYDENCRVLAINFGKDGYLVTMTAGHSPICEKNGKIL